MIGAAQGTIVAKVGVPSFVVTLAGLLIWQGVIRAVPKLRGVIIIEEDWINKTATYYFSARNSWIIAAVITGAYLLVVTQRRHRSAQDPTGRSSAGADRDARRGGSRLFRRRGGLHSRHKAGCVPGGHAAHRELHAAARASPRRR